MKIKVSSILLVILCLGIMVINVYISYHQVTAFSYEKMLTLLDINYIHTIAINIFGVAVVLIYIHKIYKHETTNISKILFVILNLVFITIVFAGFGFDFKLAEKSNPVLLAIGYTSKLKGGEGILNSFSGMGKINGTDIIKKYIYLFRPAELICIFFFFLFIPGILKFSNNYRSSKSGIPKKYLLFTIIVTGGIFASITIVYNDYNIAILFVILYTLSIILLGIGTKNAIKYPLIIQDIVFGVLLYIDPMKLKPHVYKYDFYTEIVLSDIEKGKTISEAFAAYKDRYLGDQIRDYIAERGPILTCFKEYGFENGVVALLLTLGLLGVVLYKMAVNIYYILKHKRDDIYNSKYISSCIIVIFSVHLGFMIIMGLVYEPYDSTAFETIPFFGCSTFNVMIWLFEVIFMVLFTPDLKSVNSPNKSGKVNQS